MFAKKKALFVPPGDAYADDPTSYSSRRNLPYSTLSRNHRVRCLRGGDPKNSMPRQFDGWFLEKERVVDVEEGMKWKDIIVRRIKFYIVAVLSSSLYDYVYLAMLLAITGMVPYYEMMSTVAQNNGDEYAKGFPAYDDRNDMRHLIGLVALAMVRVAALPIVGGAFVRVFLLGFVKKESGVYDEGRLRRFGVFFFVSLKVWHFVFDLRKVLPNFIGRRIPEINLGARLSKMAKMFKRDKKIGPGEEEEGGAEGEEGSVAEGSVAEDSPAADPNAENKKRAPRGTQAAAKAAMGQGADEIPLDWEDNLDDDNAEDTFDSDEDVSDEEEFDIGENEIAWNCRVCNEFNLQEKVAAQKSLKSRRLGTKENAANIRIVVRTVGKIHEHYVCEFKHLKHTNHCRKCWTPSDYKPQQCNSHSFYPQNDYREQLHEVNLHLAEGGGEEALEEGRVSPPPVVARAPGGRKGGRDSILRFEHKDIAEGLKSNELTFVDKLQLIKMKWGNYVHSLLDPELKANQVLYNDHTFKTELKKFMPFVERRELAKGERFAIGDRVEAIERQVVWYPGVIKRAGANGCYDVLYDNGELIETILPVKVRYQQTYRLSRLARFSLLNMLVFCMFGPAPMSLLYSLDEPTFAEPVPAATYTLTMAPMALYLSLGLVAVLFSFFATFMKTAQAGVKKHVMLTVYWLLPYISSLMFVHIVNEKMAATTGSNRIKVEGMESGFMWYHATISMAFTCIFTSIQWRQINHLFGTMCWALTFPMIIFAVLFALDLDQIFILTPANPKFDKGNNLPVVNAAGSYLLYAPLIVACLMLLVFRAFVPYVRSGQY